MPERSFGRTVRYRRTKLGLSQAKLGELVGRSATTVRSWERDKSHPSDSSVLTALAAILGVDERSLFEKVGRKPPEVESSPTIEQELATLDPELAAATDFGSDSGEVEETAAPTPDEPPALLEEQLPEPVLSASPAPPEPGVAPAYAPPAPRYVVTAAVPPVYERSYMEESSQRQLYRLRYLATVVILVALGVALVWALGEGFGAMGDWWERFFGNLRL